MTERQRRREGERGSGGGREGERERGTERERGLWGERARETEREGDREERRECGMSQLICALGHESSAPSEVTFSQPED